MAEEKGKRITCNRCGAAVFLKFEGMEPQEWSQPKEKYEKAPAGWAAAISLGKDIDLCPACTDDWVKLQKAFMAQEPIIYPEG